MRRRVEFSLQYWGGAPRHGRYLTFESVPDERCVELGISDAEPFATWRHAWSDGQSAVVTARIMRKGERRERSDGFMGYEWMVRNLVEWGHTQCICDVDEGRAKRFMRTRHNGEQWLECENCHSWSKPPVEVAP